MQAPPLRTPHRTHMHSALECRPHSAQNLSPRRSSTSHSGNRVRRRNDSATASAPSEAPFCSFAASLKTHQISRAPKGVSLLSLGFACSDGRQLLARQVRTRTATSIHTRLVHSVARSARADLSPVSPYYERYSRCTVEGRGNGRLELRAPNAGLFSPFLCPRCRPLCSDFDMQEVACAANVALRVRGPRPYHARRETAAETQWCYWPPQPIDAQITRTRSYVQRIREYTDAVTCGARPPAASSSPPCSTCHESSDCWRAGCPEAAERRGSGLIK
jgi:hypothetical protein